MKFVRASDIAMLSMDLDWKGNLKLIGSCLLGCIAVVVAIAVLFLLAGVAVMVIGAVVALTANAVLFYVEESVWRLTVFGIVCFGGATFFAYARHQKPRRFFNVLARGGFWFLAVLALFSYAVGFTHLTETYGRSIIFGILYSLVLASMLFSYLCYRKRKKEKDVS